MPTLPLFVPGMPGGPEMLLLLGLAVLLFGAQKLPKLARSVGESTGEFKKGRAKVEQDLDDLKQGNTPDVETDA